MIDFAMFSPAFRLVTYGVEQLHSLNAETPSPEGSESSDRFKKGGSSVLLESFTLVDESRPTQSNNWYSGRSTRILKGDLWRPGGLQKPAPLVVYSHGFMSSKREGLYLTRFLASHGYNVVAVEFPLTGLRAPGGPLFDDIVNQPEDISFVIDYLLERNSDPEDVIFDTIDTKRIAVTGLSLGSLTSMLAAFHVELLDPRIGAAVFIAGPTTMFTPKFFSSRELPTLMIYGDMDSMVIYDKHATPAQSMIPNSTLLTLKHGSHTGFSQLGATAMRYFKNPDSISSRMIKMHLGEDVWKNTDYVKLLGGSRVGVIDPGAIQPLTTPLVRRSMKASRQHMYTSLATHAFLDSVFATTAVKRKQASRYLTKTLPGENHEEVSIVF